MCRLSVEQFKDVQVFKCDFTAIRTAARTNPTIYLLKEGTILDKQGYKRMDEILKGVEALPAQKLMPVAIEDSLQK